MDVNVVLSENIGTASGKGGNALASYGCRLREESRAGDTWIVPDCGKKDRVAEIAEPCDL